MKIKLNEIPAEGRQYTFNRKTGELTKSLEDLVQQNDYDVSLFIKPIGNAYEMTGQLETQVNEICARCGWDLPVKITRRVNEILIEEEESPRNAQSVHGNNSVDFLGDGPSVSSYTGNVFDCADYVHEAVALAEPLYPFCGDEDCEHLQEAKAKQAEINQHFEQSEKTESVFSLLRDMQLKG